MPETIPPAIYNFIVSHFDSVGMIEALLLLRRETDQAWSAAAVAGRLYIPEADASELLRRLRERDLIQGGGETYRYEALVPERENLVSGLAEAHKNTLVAVTAIVHTPSRIREFANAFRLKRDRG